MPTEQFHGPGTGAFWSGETLQKNLEELIPGGIHERIENAAYSLALGGEVFITGQNVKRTVEVGQQIFIPPGQMALLLTEEKIVVPPDAIALISMKSGLKLSGLVNISGFHVDPGYSGHLVFSVYNAGPTNVPLTRGSPLFLIWYASLDQETKKVYKGKRQGITSITDTMVAALQGHVASPASLQEQIKNIQANVSEEVANLSRRVDSIKWWAEVFGLILCSGLSGAAVIFLQWLYHKFHG